MGEKKKRMEGRRRGRGRGRSREGSVLTTGDGDGGGARRRLGAGTRRRSGSEVAVNGGTGRADAGIRGRDRPRRWQRARRSRSSRRWSSMRWRRRGEERHRAEVEIWCLSSPRRRLADVESTPAHGRLGTPDLEAAEICQDGGPGRLGTGLGKWGRVVVLPCGEEEQWRGFLARRCCSSEETRPAGGAATTANN